MRQVLGFSLAFNSILVILFCLACEQNHKYKQSKKKLRGIIKEVYHGQGKGV